MLNSEKESIVQAVKPELVPKLKYLWLNTLAWNNNGTRLAVGGPPGLIQCININGTPNNPVANLGHFSWQAHTFNFGVRNIMWDHTGRDQLVSSGDDDLLRKWEVKDNKIADLVAENDLKYGFSPQFVGQRDNGQIVSLTIGNHILRFGDRFLRQESAWGAFFDKAFCAVIDNQTDRMFVGQDFGRLSYFSLADDQPFRSQLFAHYPAGTVSGLAINHNSRRLLASVGGAILSHSLEEISFGKVVDRSAEINMGGVNHLSVSPDGKLLASSGNEVVKIWQADDLAHGFIDELRFRPKDQIKGLAFSPSGELLATLISHMFQAYTLLWWINPPREFRRLAKHPLAVITFGSGINDDVLKEGGYYQEAQKTDFTRLV